MNNELDYVKYDTQSQHHQLLIKDKADALIKAIKTLIDDPVSKEYALKSLQECYMWTGKGLRNDQISRNGSAELQEERTDG